MGFSSPNYTQVPNDLFDERMCTLSDPALRVTLCIVRQTIGYHRTATKYSMAKIQKMTGLSWGSVQKGAKEAQDAGLIKRLNPGEITSAEWELVVDEEETPSNAEGSEVETPSNFRGSEEETPSNFEPHFGLNKGTKNKVTQTKAPPSRKSIEEAMWKGITKAAQRTSGVEWPADIQDYGEKWVALFGRDPIRGKGGKGGEFAQWIDELRQFRQAGITVEVMEQGYHLAAFFDQMTVSHPAGCFYAADEIQRGVRNPTGEKTKGKGRQARPPSAEA